MGLDEHRVVPGPTCKHAHGTAYFLIRGSALLREDEARRMLFQIFPRSSEWDWDWSSPSHVLGLHPASASGMCAFIYPSPSVRLPLSKWLVRLQIGLLSKLDLIKVGYSSMLFSLFAISHFSFTHVRRLCSPTCRTREESHRIISWLRKKKKKLSSWPSYRRSFTYNQSYKLVVAVAPVVWKPVFRNSYLHFLNKILSALLGIMCGFSVWLIEDPNTVPCVTLLHEGAGVLINNARKDSKCDD